METNFFDFVPASGRVLVYPIYQRMYERGSDEPLSGAAARRDLIVQWSKEVSRTVDCLETREDVDAARLAFVGLSLGAYLGPVFAAMEPASRPTSSSREGCPPGWRSGRRESIP